MIICKKCGNDFPSSIKIGDRWHGLNRRKYCLNCSPYKENKGQELRIQLNNPKYLTHRICPKCNNEYKIKDGYKNHSYCKPCINKQTIDRMHKLKLQCIEYKGGKCLDCNYNKCPAAMEFHHRDPSQKDVNISKFKCTSFGDKVKVELDKCDLLCANCHRERHYK